MDKKLISNLKMVWDLKPEEAIKFLKEQGYEISWDWKDQLQIIQKHAFTVAKVTNADILHLIHEELVNSADEGKTFAEFKESVNDVFDQAGFIPSKDNGAWRLDIIYRTNMQTAYMAGRHNEMVEVIEDYPYWQYLAVLDDRTRPAHASIDGEVLRADDSFWSTSYPPNGYRCFPAGTLISTGDGWRNIENIQVGDLVIGGSGELRKVTQTYLNSFNGKFVRIVTKKGGTVLTTPNHRILTLRGWIKAANLTIDDIIVDSTKMSPYFNDTVTNEDKLNARRLNDLITSPRNAVSSVLAVTFNANIESREVNINPKASNVVIENSINAETVQKVNHQLFASGRDSFRVRMSRWVYRLRTNLANAHFLSDIASSCRSRLSKLVRFKSLCLRSIFSFSSPIRLWCTKIIKALDSHQFTTELSPCFVVNPLNFNGFGTMSDVNIVLSQELQYGMISHVPSDTQLSDGEVLGGIEIEEGFTDGAPLSNFDSLDSFVSYALHNYSLNEIDKIEYTNLQNNTDIYNIEVEKDESYITKIGIVHNCRCRVRALDDDYITSKKLKVREGKNINYNPDEGFETNPAEAWKPDLKKYTPELAKVLGKVLK